MPVYITSKKNGFRRCGVEHSDKRTEYPDNKFSKEKIKRMQDDPMLIVEVLSKKDAAKQNTNKRLTINDFKNEIDKKIEKAVTKAINDERIRIAADYQKAYGKNAEDEFLKVILGQ